MIRTIHIVIDDQHWPELNMSVISVMDGTMSRNVQAMYDIANSAFEPHVKNALMFACRDIIAIRKENPRHETESSPPEVRGSVPENRIEARTPKAKTKNVGRAHGVHAKMARKAQK